MLDNRNVYAVHVFVGRFLFVSTSVLCHYITVRLLYHRSSTRGPIQLADWLICEDIVSMDSMVIV